jgi:hypothetical protein
MSTGGGSTRPQESHSLRRGGLRAGARALQLLLARLMRSAGHSTFTITERYVRAAKHSLPEAAIAAEAMLLLSLDTGRINAHDSGPAA